MKRQVQLTVQQMDVWILVFSIALMLVGVFFISDFSYTALQINPSDGAHPNYAAMQSIFVLSGLLVVLIASRIDYHAIVIMGIPFYCLCFCAALLFKALQVSNASWVFPSLLNIVPNTLPNLIISSTCLILARQIAAKGSQKIGLPSKTSPSSIRSYIFCAMFVFITYGLFSILPSVAGMLVFFILLGFALFLSGINLAVLMGIAALLLALIMQFSMKFSASVSHIEAWLDPWADSEGCGHELIQITYAIATGGLFGVGIGQGRLHVGLANYLVRYPLVGILHETGLVGAAAVLLLYAALFYRMVHTALHARDRLGFALAAILAIRMMMLLLLSTMASSAHIPTLSQLYLPFLSYGGSNLLIECLFMGVVLNVSRQRRITTEVT